MKLYVILDINKTLVKHKKNPVKGFDLLEDSRGYLVLRPHLRTFLEYLFKHHHVSLWTWNNHEYAMKFAELITDGHPEKFKDIMSTEDGILASNLDPEFKGKNLNHLWFGFNELSKSQDAIEYMEKRHEMLEERRKSKKYAFSTHKHFFTDYKPCNTILIDDSDVHNHDINRKNILQIPPFTATNKNDTELLKMIDKLKKIRIDCNTNAPILNGGRRKTRRRYKVSSSKLY